MAVYTLNIEIHGTLNPEVIAEEVKHHLRKECDAIKRQEEEKALTEKWAKIDRKPNEFRTGDAVRYKNAFTTVLEATMVSVTINQSNHISKNIEVSAEDLTLIFPAEARFE
jgi:hypothetical protein